MVNAQLDQIVDVDQDTQDTVKVTTGVVARMLAVSENSVRNLSDRGLLACERVGPLRVFRVIDVLALRTARSQAGR